MNLRECVYDSLIQTRYVFRHEYEKWCEYKQSGSNRKDFSLIQTKLKR